MAFSAMAVGKNTLYMLGGRESLYMNSQVYLSVLASVFSICLLYFYVCLYMNSQIFLFVLVYLLICLFICILIHSKSVSLSTCLFYLSFTGIYVSASVFFICLFVYILIHRYMCRIICLISYLFVCIWIHRDICLSFYLFMNSHEYLFVSPFVFLSLYKFTDIPVLASAFLSVSN